MMRQRKRETGAVERDFTFRGASGTALAWSGWLVICMVVRVARWTSVWLPGGMAGAPVACMVGWLFVPLAA